MLYTEPKIIRTDDAVLAIQSVSGVPDSQKPSGQNLDNARTILTTPNAYEADE